jgi:hypothetical protein
MAAGVDVLNPPAAPPPRGADRHRLADSRKWSSVRDFPAACLTVGNLEEQLEAIYRYVEVEALEGIEWYFAHASTKKWGSCISRYLVLVFGGVAGLVPILVAIWPQEWAWLTLPPQQWSLVSSLLLGVVAVLLAVDRYGDFSSGWVRYTLTGFEIRRALQDFRMEWVRYRLRSPAPIRAQDVELAVGLAQKFVLAVEASIGGETRQWASEFQQNLSQMETEVRARWDAQEKARAAAGEVRPGVLELTVQDAAKTTDRGFSVVLRGANGREIANDRVTRESTWVKTDVAPGVYELQVKGQIGTENHSKRRVVFAKANEATSVILALQDVP